MYKEEISLGEAILPGYFIIIHRLQILKKNLIEIQIMLCYDNFEIQI